MDNLRAPPLYTASMKSLHSIAIAFAAVFAVSTAAALEPRTWIVVDGRVIEATLQSVSGNLATLLDNAGHKIQLDRSFLSIGDNNYIEENFPAPKKSAFTTTQAPQMPQPAKSAKIDPKTFVPGKEAFTLTNHAFEVMETPHFKIMYQKPVNPKDVCELAERLWLDAAYVHGTLPQKFVGGRKMAVFLAPDDQTYDYIGEWYANLLKDAGQVENAARTRATWKQSGSANLYLPREISDKHNVVELGRVFRAYRQGSTPKAKVEMIRGVWTPFFTHCLAGDMLDLQAPGTSAFGAKGFFAITKGHSYFKEVSLTGKSETNLLRTQSATGVDVSTVRGLEDARQWAGELKKWVKKGDVKPTFETLNGLRSDTTDVKGNVLSYAWAHYLQSTLPKLSAFNKLIEQIATSRQVPDPADIAKIYGFSNAAAMEADFLKWLTSSDFR